MKSAACRAARAILIAPPPHRTLGRLKEALEELTPEHRAVILLREVEGLSYDEISDVLQFRAER